MIMKQYNINELLPADYVKEYINSLGGFEKFAEWGIQY